MNDPKKKSIGKSSKAEDIMHEDDERAENIDETLCLLVMEAPPSCDEELANFHATLFGVMEKNNIQPKMVSRSEVLSAHKSNSDIYVLPIFEGPEFDHLISKGCNVIGPFVVDHCMKAEKRFPKLTHPIYSLSMEGAVVCFSGLGKKDTNKLTELVMRMGGIVSNDLHDKVTILIAKNCNTDYPKYTESAKLKIPILREDWITDSWTEIIDRLTDEPVTTNKVYDLYRVPLFTEMVITVSGLSVSEKSNASRLIEMGKGEFTPEMTRNKCTHLITDKNSGDKFKKAREWGIRIVTLKWLMKSCELGYIQKESHYDPESIRTNTPKKGANPPDDLDFSMVAHAPNHVFNQYTLSSGMNSSINSTMKTTNDISVVKQSFMRNDSSRLMSTVDVTIEEPRIIDATKDIDIAIMNGDEDFFEDEHEEEDSMVREIMEEMEQEALRSISTPSSSSPSNRHNPAPLIAGRNHAPPPSPNFAPTIEVQEDGRVSVSILPSTSGQHTLEGTWNGVMLAPIIVSVSKISDDDNVTVFGDGIVRAAIGQEATFMVATKVTKELLEISIDSPTHHLAPLVVDEYEGMWRVKWTPSVGGIHSIHVVVGGVTIEQGPFMVHVSGPSLSPSRGPSSSTPPPRVRRRPCQGVRKRQKIKQRKQMEREKEVDLFSLHKNIHE